MVKKVGTEKAQNTSNPAVHKTNNLKRLYLPIHSLIPNELNPNEMTDEQFNLLYDNMEKVGLTDAILVRKINNEYRIVGGHHRWEVAKLLDFKEVPVTVIDDPDFDDDAEKFQAVRHNIIHGKMSPQKFTKLWESLTQKYTEEAASEMFGFASEEEFRKMVIATAESLPPGMKDTFLAASKEIKTIEGLSSVLNRLFTTYGDTLPFGYMVFDFGNQDNLWLRMQKKQKKDFDKLADICREKQVSMDGVMTLLLQLIAKKDLSQSSFEEGISKLPPLIMGSGEYPTEDEQEKFDYSGSL